MADEPRSRRKPRIRKAAPSVREQIDEASKKSESEPKGKKSAIRRGFSDIGHAIARILRPLSPIGRFLKKILHWLTPRYFINSWRELKLVTWPTRKETWRLTGAVFVFALVFGALVAVVDKGLDEIFKKLILRH